MKDETKLSREWMVDLRHNIKQPIKAVKIHGHPAQETMVDYLIWFAGRSICIEFKTLTDGSTIAGKQDDFLKAINRCGSIALIIIFADLKNWKNWICYKRHKDQYFVVHYESPAELIKNLVKDISLDTTINTVL